MGFIQKKWRWWIVMKIDKKMTFWCTRSHDIVIHFPGHMTLWYTWPSMTCWTTLHFTRIDFQCIKIRKYKECLSALYKPNNSKESSVESGPGLHSTCVNVRPILTKPLQIKPCNKCCNWFFNSLFQKLNWQLAQYYSAQISALTRECPLQQCTCLSQWS